MSLNDDIARGCLEDGQPIEARWGSGWWSCQDEEPEPDPWDGAPCPKCENMLHTFCGEFAEDCEKCGTKWLTEKDSPEIVAILAKIGKTEEIPNDTRSE